jgi:transglutaminase-like putative cysteine protease
MGQARMTTTLERPSTKGPGKGPAPADVLRASRPPVPVRPHAWRRMLLLAGTLMVALAGLQATLTGSSWWIVGSVFFLLVLITTTLVRQLTRPAWLPTVAGVLVTVVGLTVGYGADTAALGIIPTTETTARFAELSNDAWGEIAVQSLPATPELSIVFLIAVSCALLALFADIALRIAPALTALPILTLLAVPVAVQAGISQPYWFAISAVGYLALLRVGRRRTTGPSVIMLGAVVVFGALLVGTVLPIAQPAPDDSGGVGLSTGINPLINLGDDLRRGAPVTAVTYTTSDDQGAYLRLATLDTFDGRSWTPSLVGPAAKDTMDAFPAPAGLTSPIKTSKVTAAITVGGIQGTWLPVPYPTTKVTGTTGTWFWESQGLSVRSENASVSGQTYTASYLDVQPDLAQLRSSGTNQTVSRSYLSLPKRLPQIITDTAQNVAGSAATDYDKALALQNYFRSSAFTYSTTAPVKQGYDGTGADVVAEFLQKKAGYCVHFASAMAIMARVLGIPSRVAVGFQPGEVTTVGGQDVFTVSTHDLHAWPELYFQGIGWLRFEPTPSRGVLPDYSNPAAVDSLPTDAPSTAATSGASASADASSGPGPKELTDGAGPSTESASQGLGTAPLVLLILVLILLAVGLTPAVARMVVRLRRERDIARGRDPATNAWAEVRDTARDHGWLAPETETAREFAARLSMVLIEDSARIAGFRGDIESHAYGRPDAATLSLPELREIRRAIGRSVAPRERLRAIFLPSSILARVRFDPDA